MSADDVLRVLLVEDHALFRRGLRRLLEEQGFEVVGEGSNGQAGVRLAQELRPDVVVMDLHMPIMTGVEATRQIMACLPRPQVVMLTMSEQDDDVLDALTAGASGYLLKDAEPDVIAGAIRAAAVGDVTIDPATAGALVDRLRATPSPADVPAPATLSPRELEVLALVVEGFENAEIGQRLHLSPSTVKSHVSSILAKLGVDSRVQAAVLAVRSGLV